VTPGAVGAGGQTSANGNSGSPDASGNSNSPGSASSNSDTGSNSGLGFNVGPTFGGGGILGVASTSKAKTIRVFFGKNHYNDWLFIYYQTGINLPGLLMGPVNPNQPPTPNIGGFPPGQPVAGAPGQSQGLTPNTGQTQAGPQPQQNPGQTPPQQ
jgi:hypothetical protein